MLMRLAPAATLLLLLGPIFAGVAGVLLPALGYFPALGRTQFSLDAWRELASTPGLARSVEVSLLVGFGATLISLLIVVLLAAVSHGTRLFGLIRRSLSPVLAIPHVAVAIGLAFVIAPSGLLFRFWSSYLGGPPLPPDLLIVNDTWGLSLMGALVLKETPFLFLMVLAALPQADAERSMAQARTLGYYRIAAWLKAVLPLYSRALADANMVQWSENHPIRVATAEGLILTKMLAFRSQDQVDIETLLIANSDEIDIELIRREWGPFAATEVERTAWLESAFARFVPSRSK